MIRGSGKMLHPVKFSLEPSNRPMQNREVTQSRFEDYSHNRAASRRTVATEVNKQEININTIDGPNSYPSIEGMFYNKTRSVAPTSYLDNFEHRDPVGTETAWFPITVRTNVFQERITRDTRVEQRINFND
jgi:hypothetical protein